MEIPGVAADFASAGFASAAFASGETCAAAEKGTTVEKLVRRHEKTTNFDREEDCVAIMIQILHRCFETAHNPNKYFAILKGR
jgi:hypothetical protein